MIHGTGFDLGDAFESISHPPIPFTLSRNHFPPVIQCLYSPFSATVTNSSWSSSSFSISRGVFQGDVLSPIVFILCFIPLLDFLKQNSEFGYNFQNSSIISLPYADDFNLIPANNRIHQRLLSKLTIRTDSMNLELNTSKHSFLSKVSGSPKNFPFTLSNLTISTFFDIPRYYFGCHRSLCFFLSWSQFSS